MSRSAFLPAPNSSKSWLTTPDYSARPVCGKSEFIQACRFGREFEFPPGGMVKAYRRVTRIAEPCIFGPVLAWLGSSSGSIRLAGWRT
jgi:hypothetical protein